MWWPFSLFRSAFRKQAERYFAFLTEEFGCAAPTYSDRHWWENTLVYKNASTGVIIRDQIYDFPGVHIELARLKDGQFPPCPIFVHLEKSLEQFFLDDLVALRDPAQGKLPHNRKGLPLLASLTKVHGEKILRGDFSEFPALEAIVRRRAQELGEADYPKTYRLG